MALKLVPQTSPPTLISIGFGGNPYSTASAARFT